MLSALRLTRINLYKHLGTVNFWTPFLLAMAAVYEFAHSLADMASYYSIPVNGFSIVFFLGEEYSLFIIFIGIFILFSDLPFKDNQQMFLLPRSGKRAWIFSQIFYVIVVSIMYFAFIFLCYCAVLLPNLSLDPADWGKIIKTIAANNYSQKYTAQFGLMVGVPQSVISDFSPLEGFLYSFGIALFIAVIIGLVAFIFNLTVKRNAGVIISGAIIFMYLFVLWNRDGYTMLYFSPLNWISIFTADKNGISPYPDIPWIITVLCVWFALELIALFIFGSKRVKFVLDTKEELK